jgi:hypothetical protein
VAGRFEGAIPAEALPQQIHPTKLMYLSKSDFKVARTCGTKLYYRKLRYPSKFDDDPYLEFLADGGYMVETIAKLLFPEGKEIGFGSGDDAISLTSEAMKQEDVTLFEATFLFGQLLARVDILEKHGNHIRLMEVKAKSFRPQPDALSPFRGKRGGISAKWQPYLEDMAFQTYIVRSLYPEAQVTPFLCLVDKSKTCSAETSFDNFQIEPRKRQEGKQGFSRPKVVFTGNAEALRNDPFLTVVNVCHEVEELLPVVRGSGATFSASLAGETPVRLSPMLGVKCKKCEYRMDGGTKSGFQECWGKLAEVNPHLLDFYRVDVLGKIGQVAADMIAQGRCSVRDVNLSDLRKKVGERQAIQFRGTLSDAEFISAQLPQILGACKYPLHFVDFEACRTAVPYHAGMHPYEQVAFQWSCHTIPTPGAEVVHNEWINIEDSYPNFEFARSLKKIIDEAGTVFVWSHFEKTALQDVRRQLAQYGQTDYDLATWLDSIASDRGPLVDLCELAKEHYFHPRMAGSLSIKYVLPAVWFENARIRNHPWFSQYVREKGGQSLTPYEALGPLPFADDEIEDEDQVVREGTGAIRTYQEMMYGLRKSDLTFRNTYKQLLLNYCKLDTAAMVMIWMHWTGYRE